MLQDYNQLLDRISRASGIAKEEIDRRVEAKRAKLSGLISKEGAAQIIAAELGISFEKERMKISELMIGMKRANLLGKIIRLFPVKSYEKNGKSGKIGSMVLADDSGNTRVVLWDTNHIALIETNGIKEGDVIEIVNGNVRNNEVHLTGFSEIKLSKEVLENVKTERTYSEKEILSLQPGDHTKIRAFIVQAFEPRFFEVCPECSKRLIPDPSGPKCESHGRIIPARKALINFVLDDGTESMRSVVFSSQLGELGLSMGDLEPGAFTSKKEELLGKEFVFSGNVRQNKLFGNSEFIIEGLEEINIDSLIEALGR